MRAQSETSLTDRAMTETHGFFRSTRLSPRLLIPARYKVTTSELQAALERLETIAPSSRLSDKRQLLSGVRERILALRQRGHSWRSLAAELSAAIGQKVSADLLRTACMKRARRRGVRQATISAPAPTDTKATIAPVTPAKPSDDRFGAKGLKL
jgi:hypothetical protein